MTKKVELEMLMLMSLDPSVSDEKLAQLENELFPVEREYLLYGLPPGETERYAEVLLTASTDAARLDVVEKTAKKDGFHSFRRAVFVPGERVDFTKVLEG